MIPWSLKKVRVQRWKVAQKHEAGFWSRPAVLPSQQERVAGRYANILEELGETIGRRVLEVGSGPTCAAQRLNRPRQTVFVDPLMRIYRPMCREVQGGFVTALGEKLPFPNAMFDAVVSFNVIDHVISPGDFVSEMARVTVPGGLVMIGVYTHPRLSAFARTLLERTLPWARGEPHPFFFSRHSLERLLSRPGLTVQRLICVHAPQRHATLHRQDWVAVGRKTQTDA